jgi:hypothetical protein
MRPNVLQIVAVVALAAMWSSPVKAQTPTGSIVRFEIENGTYYIFDCPASQVGTSQTQLDRALPSAGIAGTGLDIGDIVSVNGSRAKGAAYEELFAGFSGSPNPPPGRLIIDGARAAIAPWDLDLLN